MQKLPFGEGIAGVDGRKNKPAEEQVQQVCDHINRFPRVETNYASDKPALSFFIIRTKTE